MSAWGGLPASGAWANQVDEEEEANGGQLDPVPGRQTSFPALGDSSYPSLGESVTVKDSKRERKSKKAVPQKMSLGSFMAAETEKSDLPTRPRERAEGEEDKRGGLGGGFKNYGGDRGKRPISSLLIASKGQCHFQMRQGLSDVELNNVQYQIGAC